MKKKPAIFLFFFLFLFSLPSFAEDLRLNEATVINLTLAQGIEAARARLDNQTGPENLREAKSIYDTLVQSSFNYLHDQSQQLNTLFGTDNQTITYDASMTQATPLGTQITASFLNERTRTNSAFATLNPAYNSRGQIDVRQPIGRNFLGTLNRNQIQAARKKAETLDALTKARLHVVAYQNLMRLWNYRWALANAQFEKQALANAARLNQSSQNKLKMGLTEKADDFAFEANEDVHRAALVVAENALTEAQEALREALNLSSDQKFTLLETKTILSLPASKEIALKEALAHRPDYLAAQKNAQAVKAQVTMAKNSRWPQLDLVGSLSSNGIDTRYAETLGKIEDWNPAFAAGVEFSFPLENRHARSQANLAKRDQALALLEIKAKELEITRQINESWEKLGRFQKLLQATSAALGHQGERVKAEEARFTEGRSMSDVVLRAQDDFLESKRARLRAQIDAEIARVTFSLAQGILIP